MKDIDVNKIFEWTDVFYMPIFTIKGQYNVEITSSKLGLWRNTDSQGEGGALTACDDTVREPMIRASEPHYAEIVKKPQITGERLQVKSWCFFGVIEARKH